MQVGLISTVCHSVTDFFTETPVCDDEFVQIQTWKSQWKKKKKKGGGGGGERVNCLNILYESGRMYLWKKQHQI